MTITLHHNFLDTTTTPTKAPTVDRWVAVRRAIEKIGNWFAPRVSCSCAEHPMRSIAAGAHHRHCHTRQLDAYASGFYWFG